MTSGLDKQEFLLTKLSRYADRYRKKHIGNPSFVAKKLRNDPQYALVFFYQRTFARAGGEQADYSATAIRALRIAARPAGFESLMSKPTADEILWKRFLDICRSQGKKPNAKLNREVVSGIARFSMKSDKRNIAARFEEQIVRDGLAEAYLSLRQLRGVGKKIASFLLRDLVTALEIEDQIPKDALWLLQPVDTWIKATAVYLWPDLARTTESFIAFYLTKQCLKHNVSPIRFNQGAWYYGSKYIGLTSKIPKTFNTLIAKR